MDWQKFLTDIAIACIPIVTGFLVNYFSKQAKVAEAALATKNMDKTTALLAHFAEVMTHAVAEVQQTYVDDMKGHNLFDAEAQAKARADAIAKFKTVISTDQLALGQELFGSLGELLTMLIESTVNKQKKTA